MDKSPPKTRCETCGTLAAETVCHICKTPRPALVSIEFFSGPRQPIRTSANEPGYWEEKREEDAQMYREEQGLEFERVWGRDRG